MNEHDCQVQPSMHQILMLRHIFSHNLFQYVNLDTFSNFDAHFVMPILNTKTDI